ncbi:MAG: C-terminal binding protein [Thermodesulfobacteriota bacterium]
MEFKVVHTCPIEGVDLGEKLLEPFNASLVKGMWITEEEIIRNGEDADAVIGVVSLHPFTRKVLKALPKCRIVAGMGIGFNTTDLDAATEYGIVVTNVPDYCLDEVSGLAIGLMLTLGHKIPQLDKAVRERQINLTMDRKAVTEIARPIFRMRNQTVGIIGFGKIGTSTALKAKGLGMRVIAYDPYVLGPVMESHGVKPVDMDTLLTDSDFISIHTPLSAETTNMIGEKEFRKMKHTCYFVNTARGGCVDQGALVRALQENLIAGAGIDVTIDEPISPRNPLLKMQNVILTGHAAWYSTSSEIEVHYKPMTQVISALKGEWPLYAVNPEVKKSWMDKWGRKA